MQSFQREYYRGPSPYYGRMPEDPGETFRSRAASSSYRAPPERPVAEPQAASARSGRPELFAFRERRGRLDWRSLANVDVDRVQRETDLETLQAHLENVTFADVELERPHRFADPEFLKVLRLAQFSLEYLLYVQNLLDTDNRSLKGLLAQAKSEADTAKEQAQKQEDELVSLRKECKKIKKAARVYEAVMKLPQNAKYAMSNGSSAGPVQVDQIKACPICAKAFTGQAFLEKHLQRRHQDQYEPGMYAPTAVAQAHVLNNNASVYGGPYAQPPLSPGRAAAAVSFAGAPASTFGNSLSFAPVNGGALGANPAAPHGSTTVNPEETRELKELRELRENLMTETDRLKSSEKELRQKLDQAVAKERELLRQKEEEMDKALHQQNLKYQEELSNFQSALRREFYDQQAALREQERKMEDLRQQLEADKVALARSKGGAGTKLLDDDDDDEGSGGDERDRRLQGSGGSGRRRDRGAQDQRTQQSEAAESLADTVREYQRQLREIQQQHERDLKRQKREAEDMLKEVQRAAQAQQQQQQRGSLKRATHDDEAESEDVPKPSPPASRAVAPTAAKRAKAPAAKTQPVRAKATEADEEDVEDLPAPSRSRSEPAEQAIVVANDEDALAAQPELGRFSVIPGRDFVVSMYDYTDHQVHAARQQVATDTTKALHENGVRAERMTQSDFAVRMQELHGQHALDTPQVKATRAQIQSDLERMAAETYDSAPAAAPKAIAGSGRGAAALALTAPAGSSRFSSLGSGKVELSDDFAVSDLSEADDSDADAAPATRPTAASRYSPATSTTVASRPKTSSSAAATEPAGGKSGAAVGSAQLPPRPPMATPKLVQAGARPTERGSGSDSDSRKKKGAAPVAAPAKNDDGEELSDESDDERRCGGSANPKRDGPIAVQPIRRDSSDDIKTRMSKAYGLEEPAPPASTAAAPAARKAGSRSGSDSDAAQRKYTTYDSGAAKSTMSRLAAEAREERERRFDSNDSAKFSSYGSAKSVKFNNETRTQSGSALPLKRESSAKWSDDDADANFGDHRPIAPAKLPAAPAARPGVVQVRPPVDLKRPSGLETNWDSDRESVDDSDIAHPSDAWRAQTGRGRRSDDDASPAASDNDDSDGIGRRASRPSQRASSRQSGAYFDSEDDIETLE